jgi:hypothetical protein
MEIEEQVEKLKMLSNEELRKKFGASKGDASLLKSSLRHYDNISNDSLTINEMADNENVTKGYIYQQRGILKKYGLLKLKVERSKTGNVKKLITQKHRDKIDYRYVCFNIADLKAANLDVEKGYYCIVELGNKEATIKFFDSEKEASEYRGKSKL